MITLTAYQAMNQIKYIVTLMKAGKYSYDQARTLCAPLLKIVNNTGREIAKKHNRRYSAIKFVGLAR